MSLQLVVTAGPNKGQVFTVQPGDNLMMGRSAHSYYQLSDPSVSRSHCQIELKGDLVELTDHGSASGTFVNGKKAQSVLLQLGDVVRLGDSELRLHMGDFPLDEALGAIGDTVPPKESNNKSGLDVDRLEELSGKTISHYDIGPVIGTGSTSMVFHATDTRDSKSVALRVLYPEFAKNEEEMQRFVRAMKTMLPLSHPNLIKVYGAGKTGDHCWVAMEYIAGENMAQVIERLGVAKMLDWKYAFKVVSHVGRALAYAAENHIVHRNVSPTNILLETPTKTVKLGDLMLVKALGGTSAQQITRPGQLVGDVAYMSPERTRGAIDVDARSDIYGLGATAYALLTGRPPFDGDTLIEKITRIRQDEPEKPTKFQMSIPSAFEGVVLKMLQKKPEDRYQTAKDLLKDVEKVGKFHGGNA